MDEWKKVKLGDICQTNLETYSLSEKWDFVNYLDTGSLTKNVVSEYQEINLPNDKLPSRARRKISVNDILYSTVRPNQEHYGIVKEVVPNMLVSTGFTVISVNQEFADSDFIYYCLTRREVIEHLQAIGEQSTSAYPSIKPTDIENLELFLPSLNEQGEIASVLRVLDDKIENNRKINHHLAAISKNYLKIFYSSNSIKLGDIFELKSGYAFKSKDWVDEGKPVIKIKDIDGITIDITNLNYVKNKSQLSKASNFEVFGKEIVMALTGATTGKIGVIPKNFKGYVNQRVGLFYAKTELSYAVLWSILQQQNIITDLIKLSSGSAQANLSPFSVNSYDLNVTFKDLIELDKVLSPLYELFCFNLSEIQRLSELRDTLLPKLLSGELSVNQATK